MGCPGFASYQIDGDGSVIVNGDRPSFSTQSSQAAELHAAWRRYGSVLQNAADSAGVPSGWLLGIMMVESGGGAATCSGCVPGCCTSWGGRQCCAFGVMQMTAPTAAAYGFSVEQVATDAGVATLAAARLLRDLLRRYDGDFVAALAAYNTGSARCTGSGLFGYASAPEYLRKVVTYSNTAITLRLPPPRGASTVLLVAAAVFGAGMFGLQRFQKRRI